MRERESCMNRFEESVVKCESKSLIIESITRENGIVLSFTKNYIHSNILVPTPGKRVY